MVHSSRILAPVGVSTKAGDAQGSGERRTAFLAHVLRARDIGQRLEPLYEQINADDQEWARLPK
jgi:hypothetical protein